MRMRFQLPERIYTRMIRAIWCLLYTSSDRKCNQFPIEVCPVCIGIDGYIFFPLGILPFYMAWHTGIITTATLQVADCVLRITHISFSLLSYIDSLVVKSRLLCHRQPGVKRESLRLWAFLPPLGEWKRWKCPNKLRDFTNPFPKTASCPIPVSYTHLVKSA